MRFQIAIPCGKVRFMEKEISAHRQTSLTVEGEAAMGRIAVWAAYLEQNLADLVGEIVGDAKMGQAITEV